MRLIAAPCAATGAANGTTAASAKARRVIIGNTRISNLRHFNLASMQLEP